MSRKKCGGWRLDYPHHSIIAVSLLVWLCRAAAVMPTAYLELIRVFSRLLEEQTATHQQQKVRLQAAVGQLLQISMLSGDGLLGALH